MEADPKRGNSTAAIEDLAVLASTAAADARARRPVVATQPPDDSGPD